MTTVPNRLTEEFRRLDDELAAVVGLPAVDAVIRRAGMLSRLSTAAAAAVLTVGALGGLTAVAHAGVGRPGPVVSDAVYPAAAATATPAAVTTTVAVPSPVPIATAAPSTTAAPPVRQTYRVRATAVPRRRITAVPVPTLRPVVPAPPVPSPAPTSTPAPSSEDEDPTTSATRAPTPTPVHTTDNAAGSTTEVHTGTASDPSGRGSAPTS